MDPEERELFAKSVGRAVAAGSGGAVDAAVAELGWADALVADERTSVSVLFEHQGAAAASSSALGVVVGTALGLPADPVVGVVLPALGAWQPTGELTGDEVTFRGVGPDGIQDRTTVAVVVTTADGLAVATVPTSDLALRVVRGLDASLRMVEVSGTQVRATTRPTPLAAWEDAVAAGRRALAHELVGAAATMLGLARDHAMERIQFGQPIATFQAVRHRLADSLVAIEAARSTLDGAWDDGTPLGAAVAKAVAGRSARLVARHSQQVLAGIGFTAEHPLHRYVRRVFVLDRMLGDAKSLTRAMGEELLRTRRLPPVLAL